jgi:hypothetical protein
MNAREYDPLLGRFVTPDTIVQFPYSSQGLNRYAYVNNNPLSFTDPSGHGLFKKIKKAVQRVANWAERVVEKHGRTIVAAAAAYFSYGWIRAEATFAAAGTSMSGSTAFLVGDIAGGAAAGGVFGGISTGNTKGAYLGALSGGTLGWLGNYGTLGQMIGSGINGYLQTGDTKGFLRGFLSGGIPQDLGFKNAYNDNRWANVSIGIGRDALRGYVVGGKDGISSGIAYGQFNNAVGHLVGLTTGTFKDFKDGMFIYEKTTGGGITFGNVIIGGKDFLMDPINVLHERNHYENQVEQALGVLYIPAHMVDLASGNIGTMLGFKCSGYILEEHVQKYSYSSMGHSCNQ